MEIRPLLPDQLLRHLQERNAPAIVHVLETAGGRPGGAPQLLRAMRRFAGHHAVRPGEWPATVVLDAVADLLPTVVGEEETGLLRAAAGYLLTLPAEPPNIERFDLATPSPDVIPISLLEDALATGNLGSICQALARLAGVIRSHEAFLELLLEAAAGDPLASGRRWVHTVACVKAMNDLSWDEGRGIALRWAEDLASVPIPQAPVVAEMPEAVPVRAGFAASLDAAAPTGLWPPLAHAFQGERYAETRRKSVRAGLRDWIATRLFDGDAARMDAEEAARGATAADGSDSRTAELSDLAGRTLAGRIRDRVPAAAQEAGEWASRLPDVDALYRWIAIATASRLETGDGETIVTVNAARWGAHLLGPKGAGRMTARLVDTLIAPRGAGAAGTERE